MSTTSQAPAHTSSNEHVLLDVYRQPALQPTPCSMCRDRAFGRCQRCGRPLCLGHMTVSAEERCVDCELEFGWTRRKIANVLTPIVLSTVVFLPITLLFLWSGQQGLEYDGGHLIAALGVTTLAVGVLLAIGGIVYRIRRNRFLRQGGHPQLLGGLEIPIAPARPGDDLSTHDPWSGRYRLEPPVPPIWARTYGVG